MSGRIRTLKPEWLEDEALVSCSIAARLLSAALMLLADDHGRGRAGAVTLGAAVFAFEPDPRGTAAAALAELERIRFVGTWCENGQTYFAIRNWTKHQRVDHPGKPRIPSPPETLWNPRESLAKVPETLAPDLRSPISISDHDPEGEHEGKPTTPEPSPAAPPPTAPPTKPKRTKPRTSCPASVDPSAAAWLEAEKVPPMAPTPEGREVAKFLDHHRGKGSLMADWAATWRTWRSNAMRFGTLSPLTVVKPPPPKPLDPNAEDPVEAMMRAERAKRWGTTG